MSKSEESKSVYKVLFYNQGQVYELYTREFYQSDMYGFIEIEGLLFGEKSQLVVDPGEEKLKNEFAGVPRSFIPIQAVIRIDEVEKEGIAKIRDASGGKVAQFPGMPFGSPNGPSNGGSSS